MGNSGALIHVGRRAGNTATLISEHYLEIEYLLNRVEQAATHYQALGVERSATNEEVILAYHKTVSVLHPSYYKVRAAFPDDMLARIDRSFNKVSQAFSVLTNHRKRMEYDKTLNPRTRKPLPIETPSRPSVSPVGREKPAPEVKAPEVKAPETIDIRTYAEQPAYTKPAAEAETVNRRRCQRFKLTVPVRVAGYEATGGKWSEVAKSIDVSRMGVAVRMRRRIRPGLVLHVTLPLPTKLRSHGFTEPGYNMYAIVRRVEPAKDGMRVIGLEFIGERPPRDFLHKPWAIFRTQEWGGPDRRREPREEQSNLVAVEFLDESMQTIGKQIAITDNVSPGGARVCVKEVPAEFEVVRVSNLSCGFESLAVVRNRYTEKDGFERLCLQFVDKKWPA